MYQSGPGNPILIPILLLVALSVALLLAGFALRRRGHLRGRGAALGWALITIAPLFGTGLVVYVTHQADLASGVVQSGRNEPPNAPQ